MAAVKLIRRFQVLPCRAFCLADRCTWLSPLPSGKGDGHEQVHAATADHARKTGHAVKVVMTRTVTLGPAEDGAA